MRKPGKRAFMVLAGLLALLLIVPAVAWLSLTYRPDFYQRTKRITPAQQAEQAERFVSQTLQLRNDIINEPSWEAVFTDQQVNAWLAKDLVTEFADQLPPEIREPRIQFGLDRVSLAFELDEGPIRSVVWVVARAIMLEPNQLELTIEKIRAGVVPIPAERIVTRIVNQARAHGLDVQQSQVDGLPVITLAYRTNADREDVLLEQVQIREGEIRLAGTSNQSKGQVSSPVLPSRKVLQSKFPRRKAHEVPRLESGDAPPARRSSATPET